MIPFSNVVYLCVERKQSPRNEQTCLGVPFVAFCSCQWRLARLHFHDAVFHFFHSQAICVQIWHENTIPFYFPVARAAMLKFGAEGLSAST